MNAPLVSILVPTWNRAADLADSLTSTLGQDYSPIEILISDNGSTDGTEELCRAAAGRDPRIRYFRRPHNIGLYGNHNFLIDQSRGEFLCFFHDHDERELSLVSRCVQFLQQHPEVGVVSSDWWLLDAQKRRIGVRDYPVDEVMSGLDFISRTIRSGRSSIGVPGAMIRRAALGAIRFDEAAPIGFGDFVVWFQMAEHHAIGHLKEHLWSWRQDARSQSARTIESLTHDYFVNVSTYCHGHLARWPDHASLVAQWRRWIHRYLFWALLFEVGLHCRQGSRFGGANVKDPTLFDILDYRLTPEQFRGVFQQLERHRDGPVHYLTLEVVKLLIRLRMTMPLALATRYYTSVGALLGMR